MTTRYEATLNNVTLSSLDTDIIIHDISYSNANIKDETLSVAKRNGLRLMRRSFNSIKVSIVFEIHAYDVAERQSICQAVCTWAKNGGTLKTSDRTGVFLRCVCSKFPSISSAKNWIDELEVEFTAYAIPFWQDNSKTSIALTAGTSGSTTQTISGNVDGALVEADIVANASLTSVALTVNSRTLTLSNLSVSSGSTIKITYNSDGIQSIKVGSTSLLNKRTGVDDLLVNCGESNTFSFTSSASVTVTFKVRGLWV